MFQKNILKLVVLVLTTSVLWSCHTSSFGTVNSEVEAGGPNNISQEIVCDSGFDLIGDQCLVKCAANQARNLQGVCVNNQLTCLSNEEIVNGVCRARCGSNQFRNAAGNCENNPPSCVAPQEMVNGVCRNPCGANQFRNAAGNCENNPVNTCTNGASNYPSCTNCGVDKHLEAGSCVSNRRGCQSNPEGTFGGYEEWANGSWSSCRNFTAATCSVPAGYSWGGGCRGSNGASTLNYGQQLTISNTSDLANSGSVTIKCTQSSQVNGYPSHISESCDVKPVFEFHRLEIEYSGAVQPVTDNYLISQGVKGRLLEAADPTYFKDTTNVAYLEDITAINPANNNWLHAITTSFNNPDISRPSKARLYECAKGQMNNCRFQDIAFTDLNWTISSANNGASLFQPGSNWVCIDAGMSVADKRGLLDCGARGSVAAMITYQNGELKSSNTRGAAEGRFIIRATVKSSTPNFGHYAGSFGEYGIDFLNRFDIKITSNMTSFSGYGRMIHWINGVGPSGYNDAVTLQTKNCTAVTDTGVNLPIDFETYNGNNQFAIRSSAINALPAGATYNVKISCTASLYNSNHSATDVHYVKIIK